MLKIGLTGGIACGKSFIGHLFKVYGVPIIDADVIAREVVEPGMPALKKIAEYFGAEILDEQGALKRRSLRKIVFSSPEALQVLNAITHPAIHQRLEEFIDLVSSGSPLPKSYLRLLPQDKIDPSLKAAFSEPLDPSLIFKPSEIPPYMLLDIPLLIENKLTGIVDRVLVVDVDPELQVQRIMQRDQSTKEAACKIIAAQISREERLKYADDIIDTSSSNLEEKCLYVLNLHQKFIRLARAHEK